MIPYVSILVPMRNEAAFIANCLDSILENDYPKDRLEILVIDGMSTDGSREIVQECAMRVPWIRLLENPKKIVPTGLNIGIAHAKGDIIMLMNAHSTYSHNYISELVAWLEKSGADNVGGVCVTYPANDTSMAQAIAIGLSHPFGVGNSHFRIGAAEPRWVDTVPYGCFTREVFDRIGTFDEQLARNQDDEFNFRLARRGGRVLLVPHVVSYYFARESASKLWRMYYQYGYFKPLVARKVGRIMTVRQLIPPLFVLGLLGSALLAPWSRAMWLVLVSIVGAYATAAIACSISVALKRGGRCGLALCMVFPLMHVSYGLGFLKGMLDLLVFGRKGAQDIAGIPITR
jgi:GT2 family glycosyltransferase